jgi:ABC-2 type transport system permease protein
MSELAVLTWRQYRLERRMFWRNPSAAFFNCLLPLLFLALFGAVFSSSPRNLEVVLPGIAAMAVMATTFTALAFNLTFLREQGVLKRIRGTPLPPAAYLFGAALSALTNTAMQIAIVVVAARIVFGLGWPRDWIELAVFTAAGVVCFASLGVALSHAIPSFDSAAVYVNVIFLPALIISGVSYVPDAPVFLRDIAEVLPLKHVIDGLAGAMLTGRGLSANLGGLAVVLLWAAVGVFLAVRGFSWAPRRS